VSVIDIDVYGNQNYDGTAVEYVDSAAVNNALYCFLISKKGDFYTTLHKGELWMFLSLRQ